MTHPIRIYGVPMDLGQQRRGVDMGASAIRYAGLQRKLEVLGYTVTDGGNLAVPIAEQLNEQPHPTDGSAHNFTSIRAISQQTHQHMRRCVEADETAIFLGGDHSMSIGTVSGALYRSGKLGVLWIDAHGDFNTPQTSPSGNIHGMVVTSLMGMWSLRVGDHLLTPEQIAFIGIRDLDVEEKTALHSSGAAVYTMRAIDEEGMAAIVRRALDRLGDVDAIHISLDMDSLDPTIAPGVGTPVPGGLTYREAHLIMEMLADDGRVRSLDIVEVNPILDLANRTAEQAVALAASLFGQRIY